MATQAQKIQTFRKLHQKNNPLILYNIWDAGTATTVANAGAPAIATGSWAVGAAHGVKDGENLPLEAAMQNLRRICSAVDLPVTADLESGYGQDPQTVALTVSEAMRCGAIGFNLEDQIMGAGKLYKSAAQCERISAARRAANTQDGSAFLNARTDIFFQAGPDEGMDGLVGHAIDRAKAYHQAGADGFFAPGLIDEKAIEVLSAAAPLPVNIMVMPGCPDPATLTRLGVSRISYGPGPYLGVMDTISADAKALYA